MQVVEVAQQPPQGIPGKLQLVHCCHLCLGLVDHDEAVLEGAPAGLLLPRLLLPRLVLLRLLLPRLLLPRLLLLRLLLPRLLLPCLLLLLLLLLGLLLLLLLGLLRLGLLLLLGLLSLRSRAGIVHSSVNLPIGMTA